MEIYTCLVVVFKMKMLKEERLSLFNGRKGVDCCLKKNERAIRKKNNKLQEENDLNGNY